MDKNVLAELTADIVAAHVSNNTIAVSDMPDLIHRVHTALLGLGQSATDNAKKTPRVSVRSSIKPDFIVCLECGKQQKALRRHIRMAHNISPEEYRSDYGLPDSYPMVAPNYSEKRRELAKSIGLGRGGRGKKRLTMKNRG